MMPTFLTRPQIEEKLIQLDAKAAQWFQHHGDSGDFWCKFADEADDITENVGPEDDDWAFEQIDAILEKNGLNPNWDHSPCDG